MAIGTPVTLGTNSATTSATTIALTTSASVAAGETVLIAALDVDGTAVNPSCAGGGLTWTLDKVKFDATNGATLALFSAPAPAGLAASTVITVTFNTSTTRRLIAGMSISGLATSSPADVSATSGPTTGTAWASGTTGTRTTATQISIAIAGALAATTPAATSTITAPYTELHDFNVGTALPWTTLTTAYHQESSAGTSAAAGTWSKSTPWDGLVVTYKSGGTTHALAGTPAGVSTLAGSLRENPLVMRGTIPGVSTLAGALRENKLALRGTIPGVSTLAGALRENLLMLRGTTIAGQSALSGAIHTNFHLAGVITGQSAVFATMSGGRLDRSGRWVDAIDYPTGTWVDSPDDTPGTWNPL